MTTVYIWPDGDYAEDKTQLAEMLQWKSDDYRTVNIDDTFDLEKQLFGDDDASPQENSDAPAPTKP